MNIYEYFQNPRPAKSGSRFFSKEEVLGAALKRFVSIQRDPNELARRRALEISIRLSDIILNKHDRELGKSWVPLKPIKKYRPRFHCRQSPPPPSTESEQSVPRIWREANAHMRLADELAASGS